MDKVQFFSTEDVTPEQRLDYWNEVVAGTFLGCSVDVRDEDVLVEEPHPDRSVSRAVLHPDPSAPQRAAGVSLYTAATRCPASANGRTLAKAYGVVGGTSSAVSDHAPSVSRSSTAMVL